jgi:hypothetical protein
VKKRGSITDHSLPVFDLNRNSFPFPHKVSLIFVSRNVEMESRPMK